MKSPRTLLWGLGVAASLLLGCSAGQPMLTVPGTDTGEPTSRQVTRQEAGYQVQQGDLRPGRPKTPQRQRYCEQWQCAFVSPEDRNWCMRGCVTTWDLK